MRGKSVSWACLQAFAGVLFAVAIALALGAVWLAIALRMPSAHWWFALVAGAAMGYTTRAWVTRRRPWATVLAVPGTLLAMIYMQCLYVGLELAAVMGLGYFDTLWRAGLGMLLALARASLDTHLVAATLAGMAIAGAVAWFERSRTSTAIKRRAP